MNKLPLRTDGPAAIDDPRHDMMFLLSPSTSLDHLCRQTWTISVSTDIPGPVGLGDSGLASVAVPGWPVLPQLGIET